MYLAPGRFAFGGPEGARGGLVHSNRWAALFACVSTRAVHIEVLKSMDTSSLINSLRIFLAIRGTVSSFVQNFKQY